jgi:hypothetical protein
MSCMVSITDILTHFSLLNTQEYTADSSV